MSSSVERDRSATQTPPEATPAPGVVGRPTSGPMHPESLAGVGELPSSQSRLWVLTANFLREQWRPVLIWGIALGLTNVLYVALFPGFKDTLSDYLRSMPATYMAFLGFDVGQEVTVQSFLSMEMFAVIAPLALPFFVILLGARTLAGAEDRQQLDVLLSNPVSRWHLIVGRFVTMAACLFAILGLMTGVTLVGAVLAGVDLPPVDLVWGALNLLPFSLFFGGLALLLSSVLRRTSVVIAVPAALLVSMYVVNGLANSVTSFKPARWASLFHYYGAAILEGIRWGYFAGILAVAVLFALAAVLAFRRRDILI